MKSGSEARSVEVDGESMALETFSTGFRACPETLAWLDGFTLLHDNQRTEYLKDVYPWLWDSAWGDSVGANSEGIDKLRGAIHRAESMVNSLENLLGVAKDRMEVLRSSMKTTCARTYFPRLSDDILAIIFEFASSRTSDGKPDFQTPSRILRVSRRFRDLALQLPVLWRILDSERQPVEVMRLFASRCTSAGPILEARFSCDASYSTRSIELDEWSTSHLTYLRHLKLLSTHLASLHFDYSLYYNQQIVGILSMPEPFRQLSLPSLQELRVDYRDGAITNRDGPLVHFFSEWHLPCLKSLKVSNVIPQLRQEVLGALTECTLSLTVGRDDGFRGRWDLSKAMEFLGKLSEVKDLRIDLCSDKIHATENTLPIVSLTSVERFSLSLIGVDCLAASEFIRALRTPSKSIWRVEVKDTFDWPLARQLKTIFRDVAPSDAPEAPSILLNLEPLKNEKDFDEYVKNLKNIFPEFGRSDCYDVMNSVLRYDNTRGTLASLEKLSISYPDGEQGFFGIDCQNGLQVGKVELKDCKGVVKEVLGRLKKRFANEPGNGGACVSVDGSSIQISKSGIDELVANAQIVRKE
ncbi:hypothetical protein SCHPADRAFT_203583 [Schizopora paradoxa]|uniref:F-box domain-containing protein n=1 Tax=Schizopora paradoxa TaxID=27342 RepID=A0A0H2RYM8_9AGAM|nr:hypothetical protein SCHPADRAFT_203583 [Schizopora paradoxa]